MSTEEDTTLQGLCDATIHSESDLGMGILKNGKVLWRFWNLLAEFYKKLEAKCDMCGYKQYPKLCTFMCKERLTPREIMGGG